MREIITDFAYSSYELSRVKKRTSLKNFIQLSYNLLYYVKS